MILEKFRGNETMCPAPYQPVTIKTKTGCMSTVEYAVKRPQKDRSFLPVSHAVSAQP
jgi:hypothetical protein